MAKADAVVRRGSPNAIQDAIVIGCDSMLLVDGDLVGKPHTRDAAALRWHAQSGHVGDLLTGHAVIRGSIGRFDRSRGRNRRHHGAFRRADP